MRTRDKPKPTAYIRLPNGQAVIVKAVRQNYQIAIVRLDLKTPKVMSFHLTPPSMMPSLRRLRGAHPKHIYQPLRVFWSREPPDLRYRSYP